MWNMFTSIKIVKNLKKSINIMFFDMLNILNYKMIKIFTSFMSPGLFHRNQYIIKTCINKNIKRLII